MQTASRPSLLIVGGGSSGWMTALYLQKLFNEQQTHMDITVVESSDIGIIGVGEATVHTIRSFYAALDLDETELLAASNATLKLGILFRNWKKPVDGRMHEYFHPFEQQSMGSVADIASGWLLSERFKHERYDEGVSLATHLVQAGHCPKGPDSRNYQGLVPYGYHLDATLMARFLREKAVARGVCHIDTKVTAVEHAEGFIEAVQTDAGRITADFFIDCTGFRGLLIEKLRSDNWVSYEDALPCNKAVAMQVEYKGGETPKPYTAATALANGWVWEIDLIHRRGTGYVYDGTRLSREQAEAELRAHLGPDTVVRKMLHLDMKVGRRKEMWVGNCLAVGLAGGFIEPLESTGLHLINLGARLLATHTPVKHAAQSVRDSYNKIMTGFYEDLKRFIVLHYCLTDRDDSAFWKAAQDKAQYCGKLPQMIELWRHKICEYADLADSYSTIFTDENYRYVLYGMNCYPQLHMPCDANRFSAHFDQFKRSTIVAKKSTLPHRDFLETLRARGGERGSAAQQADA